MRIEIKIDPECKEPQIISGFLGDVLHVLDPTDILRIYVSNGKVFADTEKDEYAPRLYDPEIS